MDVIQRHNGRLVGRLSTSVKRVASYARRVSERSLSVVPDGINVLKLFNAKNKRHSSSGKSRRKASRRKASNANSLPVVR